MDGPARRGEGMVKARTDGNKAVVFHAGGMGGDQGAAVQFCCSLPPTPTPPHPPLLVVKGRLAELNVSSLSSALLEKAEQDAAE